MIDQTTKYGKLIRTFADFPIKGINFIDWMPVMYDAEALDALVEDMLALVKDQKFTKVAGLESRGFMVGIPIAKKLSVGFVPVRKKGKLPGPCIQQAYALEYGMDAIEIQEDAIKADDKVLVVDDLLATGGTMNAANKLIGKITKNITDIFFIELTDLDGKRFIDCPYYSLLKMTEK